MYSLSQLRRGIEAGVSTPALFGREFNRLYHRRLFRHDHNTAGVDIFAEDWDILVVLDACRYDLFEKHHDLPGDLTAKYSRGSHTREFLRGNFAGRDLRDTVYVTASPQFHRWRSELQPNLHAVANVWREDGWDDEHKTVLPETTTRYAERAAERYPNKRLVVHYLQPHYPFIASELELDTARLHSSDTDEMDIWGRLMADEATVSKRRLWRAYRENLERVLPHVRTLLETVSGRTVVTADHGNMVGERSWPVPIREWGHPPGVHTEELVKVPWLVHESGTRRSIVADEGLSEADEEDVDTDVVQTRLEQLGYVE